MKLNFKRELSYKHKGTVIHKGIIFPFSVEYTEIDNQTKQSVFKVSILDYEQEFLEEDIQEFFNKTIFVILDSYIGI